MEGIIFIDVIDVFCEFVLEVFMIWKMLFALVLVCRGFVVVCIFNVAENAILFYWMLDFA